MKKIYERKYKIYDFYYKNQFASHLSSLFVYNQLKIYEDFAQIITKGFIETYAIANIWKGALNENGLNVGDGANIIQGYLNGKIAFV